MSRNQSRLVVPMILRSRGPAPAALRMVFPAMWGGLTECPQWR